MARLLLLLLVFSPLLGAPTICLNMIVKDEAPVIERCLASVRHLIDRWVIVDTGSTDGTQEIIRRALRGIPGELHERPWVDFAHNRMEALELAKKRGDYLLFIDADERLVFSSPLDKGALTQDFYCAFVRVFGEEGRYCQGQRVLLASTRFDWAWKGALHEVLVCPAARRSGLLHNVINFADSLEGHRTLDPQKGAKEIAVLEAMLQKEPDNSRTLFYLGQAHEGAKNYGLALRYYERNVALSESEQEVFWSLHRIAQIQETQGLPRETILNSYAAAFRHRPSRLEPLYYLALQYLKLDRPVWAYVLLKAGLSFPPCEDGVLHETWIYDYGLTLALASCAARLGRGEEARAAWEKVLSLRELPVEAREEARRGMAEGVAPLPPAAGKALGAGRTIEEYTAAFHASPACAEPLFYLAGQCAKENKAALAYAMAKVGAAMERPDEVPEGSEWIYDYGLLQQWGVYAFAFQKYEEAISAFEALVARPKAPYALRFEARQTLQVARTIVHDLTAHGLSSF